MQIVVILLLLCTGCGEKKEPARNTDAEKIMFMNMTEKPLDSFFTANVAKRDYINLETKEGDSGIVLVDKLISRNNKTYILYKRKAIICIYDSAGNISGTLKRRADFLKVADFDVDENGRIFVIDGQIEHLVCYDSALNLTCKKNLPYETDLIKKMPNGNFLFGLSSWNDRLNKNDRILVADSGFNVLKKHLEYDKYVDDNYWIKGYRFLEADRRIYYNKPVENFVHVLSMEGDMLKSYYFDFGNMNVPDKYKKDIEKNLSRYSDYRVLTDFTFINDKFALGKIWDKRKFRFFYLDRATNEVFLENENRSSELKYMGDFDGKNLTAVIYPGEFNEKDYGYLPPEQKIWLQKGGYVLCRYLLK